jgi:hypothetical protein
MTDRHRRDDADARLPPRAAPPCCDGCGEPIGGCICGPALAGPPAWWLDAQRDAEDAWRAATRPAPPSAREAQP